MSIKKIKNLIYNFNKKALLLILLFLIIIFMVSPLAMTQQDNNRGDSNGASLFDDENYKKGMYYLENKYYEDAVYYLNKAYHTYKDKGNVLKATITLNELGNAYFGLKNYKESFEKKLKAVDIFFSLQEKKRMKTVLVEITEYTFMLSKDTEKFDNQGNNLDEEVKENLSNIREILDFFPGIYPVTSATYQAGFTLSIAGYDDIALKLYQKGINLHKKWKYTKEDIPYINAVTQNINSMILNTGAIYEKNNEYQHAIAYYREVVSISLAYNTYNSLLPAMDGIDTIYRKAGNEKTAQNHYKYVI
ncbi:MAG: hypothetical protein ACOCV8_01660 [Spirochaetota bacterium]